MFQKTFYYLFLTDENWVKLNTQLLKDKTMIVAHTAHRATLNVSNQSHLMKEAARGLVIIYLVPITLLLISSLTSLIMDDTSNNTLCRREYCS